MKYYVRGNYQGLWRQFYQYGYWKVYVNKKHKAVTTLRQLVPPLFVLYLMMLLLSPFFSIGLFVISAVPFVLYVLMAIYFTLKIVKSDSDLKFFLVLQTFPILHVSYGLGYLKGLIDFVLLSKKPSDKQKRLSR